MKQNDHMQQMRELLKEARKIIRASSSRHLAKDWDVRATQALAATPEPAPMVRLTEGEIKVLPLLVSCTHIYHNEAIPDRDSCMDWANALQDAWIAKNRGVL